jgi:hypothetical protein
MGILDALKAATANVQSEPKTEKAQAQAKTSAKSAPKGASAKPGASKASAKTGAKSAPKPIDISSLKVKYEIPEDFKMAIRLYMEDMAKKDSAVAEKMKAKGKSIDGCCEYIYGVMMRRAAKQLTERKNTGIGISGSPEEVFGLATHYYDESDEELKKEK